MVCSVQYSTGVSRVSFGSYLDPSAGETPVPPRASTKSVEGFFYSILKNPAL